MKKILYFMPDNISTQNAGNVYRALSLLYYFKSRSFDVDFVSERSWGKWTDEDIEKITNKNISSRVFIFNRKLPKKNILSYLIFYKLYEIICRFFQGRSSKKITDFTTYLIQDDFNKLLSKNTYDYIIISYATWATLIKDKKHINSKTITIIDTHDFITAQHHSDNRKGIGACFEEELNRLNYFDNIWSISTDELFLYSQFFPNKVKWVPMMIKTPDTPVNKVIKEHDLIYIASYNNHNRNSLDWFLDLVYPLLPTTISICIIGKINEHIKQEYPNIKRINYVANLDEVYQKSKIALCPMLSGTGLKIKVVEAMSHGLPIICNERGIDGLPNKVSNGCLVSNNPIEFAENICNLLSNNELLTQYSNESKKTFNDFFEESIVYERLDKIFGTK